MQAKRIAFLFLILSTTQILADAFKKDTKTDLIDQQQTTNATTTIDDKVASYNEEKSDSVPAAKNSKLTGIPQLDYVYDPNLPRELRGYNLSSYPFFSTVPPDEDIHFKCEGLHDGFYAAIEFKCQVYHHCVYGIRHDFLCANFTAFDQKTFICHFVSDVDCEGSKKYWNRNDNLYMPTTTTSTTTTTTVPPPTVRRRPLRPQRPLRRPLKRRPIDDYYYDDEYEDAYYEEPVNRRPLTGRARPKKPIVDYEYEYERDPDRNSNFGADADTGRRRHSNNRNRYREDVDEVKDDYDSPRTLNKFVGGERRKSGSRLPNSSNLPGRRTMEDRRTFNDDRDVERPMHKDKPRVVEDANSSDPTFVSRRSSGRRRVNEKRLNEDNFNPYDVQAEEEQEEKSRTTLNPAGQSLYTRPRVPPRILRPVPLNEKNKVQYLLQKAGTSGSPSTFSATAEQIGDEPVEEYYDDNDYSYESIHSSPAVGLRRRRIQDNVDNLDERRVLYGSGRKRLRNEQRLKAQRLHNQKKDSSVYEDYENEDKVEKVSVRRLPLLTRRRSSFAAKAALDVDDPNGEDYAPGSIKTTDTVQKTGLVANRVHRKKMSPTIKTLHRPAKEQNLEEVVNDETDEVERPLLKSNKNHKNLSSVPVIKDQIQEDDDKQLESESEVEKLSRPSASKRLLNPVRFVKRPFLPSRGGSPYLPRGLQPVGVTTKHKEHHIALRESFGVGSDTINTNAHKIQNAALMQTELTEIKESSQFRKDTPPHTNQQQRQQQQSERFLNDDEVEDDEESGKDSGNQNEGDIVGYEDSGITQNQDDIVKLLQQQLAPKEKAQVALDAFYENDYDVTINDALNPTLKPLSPHPLSLQQQQQQQHNYTATSLLSSSTSTISSSSFPTNSSMPKHVANKNNIIKKLPFIASASSSSASGTASSFTGLSADDVDAPALVTSLITANHLLKYKFHHQTQALHEQNYGQQQQLHLSTTNQHKNIDCKSDSHFSSTDLRRRTTIQTSSTTTKSTAASEVGNKRPIAVPKTTAKYVDKAPAQYEDDEADYEY